MARYTCVRILDSWRNVNLIIPCSDPQHEWGKVHGAHVLWSDGRILHFTWLLIEIFLPGNMERTLCVLFLVLVGLFCVILSSSYGRKISGVPGKTVIRELYANPNHVETVNIKCTGESTHLVALLVHREINRQYYYSVYFLFEIESLDFPHICVLVHYGLRWNHEKMTRKFWSIFTLRKRRNFSLEYL